MDDFFGVSEKIVSKIQPYLPALFGCAASVVGTRKAELTRPPRFSERRRPALHLKNPIAVRFSEHR
jgi:hypothetical protein